MVSEQSNSKILYTELDAVSIVAPDFKVKKVRRSFGLDFWFNDVQKQVFEGCMLGDGGLSVTGDTCRFCNADIHKDYLVWLQKQLGVEGISKIDSVRYSRNGKTFSIYCLRTRIVHSLRDEYKRWYPYDVKGTYKNRNYKVIPRDIELTLIKVLLWYIGDGTYKHDDSSAVFTNSLSLDDAVVLSDKLKVLFNVDGCSDSSISVYKNYKDNTGSQRYKIRLNRIVTKKFFELVDNLGFSVPECYQYKFLIKSKHL
jgi:hypothetical protein